jgi:hypothetical protein
MMTPDRLVCFALRTAFPPALAGRDSCAFLDELLALIARVLPASYGLVYERSDETGNAFRVRTMARGRLTERTDPLLSPANPVIED